jgi:hypothetical protein
MLPYVTKYSKTTGCLVKLWTFTGHTFHRVFCCCCACGPLIKWYLTYYAETLNWKHAALQYKLQRLTKV